ncbi:MAG: hypothetical protein BVN35_08090 [Proteobacteria bacterium ST_bin11]|nr:MAG: hypothetical protein BVN35_08090 [Proteobacteria bacterium ST_bin11]
MRNLKYGEETRVLRVPVSRYDEVVNFLKKYEVIDEIVSVFSSASDSEYDRGYKLGFAHGFEKGEEYQFRILHLSESDEEQTELAMDLFRGRLPDASSALVLEKCLETTLGYSDRAIEHHLPLRNLVVAMFPSNSESHVIQLVKKD